MVELSAFALEWGPYAMVLLIAGSIAAFLAGLFGIGGGAILVPVFYQIFGELGVDEAVRMHVSVGTSMAIIVPTSISSFRAHLKKRAVDTDYLRSIIFAVPIGVSMASIVAAIISSGGLRVIFAAIALLVAFRMLFARESWRLGDDIPQNPNRFGAGALIGFISTFMGIGGGLLNNTFMTLFGRPLHQAVATSSGLGVLISLPGVLGYVWAGWGASGLPEYSLGYVNLLAALIIMPVTVVLAPIGANAAHALSKRRLEFIFGVFMVIVAARFVMSLFY